MFEDHCTWILVSTRIMETTPGSLGTHLKMLSPQNFLHEFWTFKLDHAGRVK
jgi:hypothetical protein